VRESLLSLLLARLDQVEAPVLSHREALSYPAGELEALLSTGILKETARATEVPRAVHDPPGDYLRVRPTAKGFFGVADGEDYHPPVPLTDDDVRQYEIVVPKLVERIRRENDLKGSSGQNGRRLVLVGEHVLPGGRRANVYLAFLNDDPSEFLSLCKKVLPVDPRPVVMLVPTPIHLSAEHVELLSTWDVAVAPLSAYLNGKRWKLPWDRILKTPARRRPEGKAQEDTYCRVITRAGTRRLGKVQYNELVKERDGYDLFIDGITREASCRHGKGTPRTATLTPKELGILGDYIQGAKPMRPHHTKTGSHCLSGASACKLFEEARRKVDVKLGRYTYRAFRLHKNPTDRQLKSYEFAPSHDLTYCLILPL